MTSGVTSTGWASWSCLGLQRYGTRAHPLGKEPVLDALVILDQPQALDGAKTANSLALAERLPQLFNKTILAAGDRPYSP